MASDTKDGSIEIALNNGYIYTNASADDLLIRTTTSNQAIHIGIDKAAMTIRSNNVIVNQRLGIGIGNTPQVTLDISGTDSIKLPTGTTAQRPQAPVQGYVRYNTDINTFEGFGLAWGSLGGVKDTNQDTYISAETYPTSNDDNLVFYNSNIERVRILRGGNVGIGTSTPSVSLEVNGSAKVNSNLTVLGNLSVSGTTTTVDSTNVNIADAILRVNNGAA